MIAFLYESPRNGNISYYMDTFKDPNFKCFRTSKKMYEYVQKKLLEGKRLRRYPNEWGDEGYNYEVCKKDFLKHGEKTSFDLKKNKKVDKNRNFFYF